MPRKWDDKSLSAFLKQRDDKLHADGKGTWDTLSTAEKKALQNEQKSKLKSSEAARIMTQSWPLEKWPLHARPSPKSGKLLLPRDYGARSGFDTVKVYAGQNLNQVVYQYYSNTVDKAPTNSTNFVSQDGLSTKRHEFMGPSPHVADYLWTGSQAQIQWWDSYERSKWMGTDKWDTELEFDKASESWFLIDKTDS
ncbi:hypothetical protein SISSUDRAFT_1062754 [Sistotremastrum suecicum HHB10207 ss-3]|uniref:Uncharacterized protein n=1 Tax=Sistotremastrum suecicum HHB10207 ss-3 TaxID=1314776 RepID=A0A166CIS1_9AGAM|nr:hypothetical protein SISSUDRAFT_1062754 [Sistotremastrum suecicum HHB10207 ss-3]